MIQSDSGSKAKRWCRDASTVDGPSRPIDISLTRDVILPLCPRHPSQNGTQTAIRHQGASGTCNRTAPDGLSIGDRAGLLQSEVWSTCRGRRERVRLWSEGGIVGSAADT